VNNKLKKKNHSNQGLTLLELLVVVFILSALALSALSFTNNADEQFRFEDTRTRIEKIKTAVIGQPEQTLNGEPAVSGFVADIGRLPNTIQELIEPLSLPDWGFDTGTNSGIWAGWRGPYLTTVTEQNSAEKAFRDGWGNPGNAAADYGWFFEDTTTIDNDVPHDGVDRTLRIQSFGSDSVVGNSSGVTYGDDYPVDVLADSSDDFIQWHDYLFNLNGWSVTVTFVNQTGAAYAGGDQVRLRLYYPQEGVFTWQVWPGDDIGRDASVFISEMQTLPNIPVGDSVDLIFGSFGSGDNFVPIGVRSLLVVDNDTLGNPFQVAVTGQKEIMILAPRRQLISSMTWAFQ